MKRVMLLVKKKYFLFFIVIFCSMYNDLAGQTVKFRVAGSCDIHLRSAETTDGTSPFQREAEKPSVSSFFNDDFGFNIDLSLRFGKDKTKDAKFFVGMAYETAALNSNSSEAKYILGENLKQNKYTPYVGIGGCLDTSRGILFGYGFVGVTFLYYSGTGEMPGTIDGQPVIFDAEYGYVKSLALRVGVGADFENIWDSPFTLGMSAYMDIGSVGRGRVKFYYYGQEVGYADPTGSLDLADNTLYFSLSLAYQFNF